MAQPKVEEKKADNGSKYEPTVESTQKLNKEDLALMEKVVQKYGDKLAPLYPNVIRNFITGYAHTAEREKETYLRIDHYLDRHTTFSFPTILDEPLQGEEAMMEAWPLYIYGFDQQGHPVVYDEIASSDTKKVDAAFTPKSDDPMELCRVYRYRFHRRLANAKRIQSEKLNTLMFKHVLVFDLKGFSSAHFGAKYRAIVQGVIGDEQNVFPETLYKCILVNSPWAFRMIWSIISNFIDPITYEKIKVLGSDYLGEMQKIINIDQIPPKYGGKGTKAIKLGHSADLPHDRYPLDYFDQLKAKQGADDGAKGSSEYEAKEQ